MKKIKTTAAAVVLTALSFGAFAAQPASQSAMTNIEAGSNQVPVAHATQGGNDAAFDAHTLVAGGWD